jgi:hypothetical protein
VKQWRTEVFEIYAVLIPQAVIGASMMQIHSVRVAEVQLMGDIAVGRMYKYTGVILMELVNNVEDLNRMNAEEILYIQEVVPAMIRTLLMIVKCIKSMYLMEEI